MPKRPTELGAERTEHLADVDAKEHQGSQRSTLEAVGWATGIAVATWALGSIVVAIGIGAILGLSGAAKPSDEAAVTLGLVDLLLIAPGIYLGARAQRLGFGWSWLVIGAVSQSLDLLTPGCRMDATVRSNPGIHPGGSPAPSAGLP
ncbi:MAG: hypothetical protein U9O18_03900 [Chloroflexota bacterium]|nr:hypothetical protein [Chloroflexota bacterium]